MPVKKIVVIGAGAAGLAAATRARRVNPEARIVVLEASQEFSRGTCSLPYFLSGEVEVSALQGISAAELEGRKIELRLGTPALAIDPRAKTVLSGHSSLPYDKLIVSTGSRGRAVPILNGGEDSPCVWRVRSQAQATRIKAQLESGTVRRVAVVGGGYVGLEAAEAFLKSGCEVVLYHRGPRLMRLHPHCHDFILSALQARGLVVKLGSAVNWVCPASGALEYDQAGGAFQDHFDAFCLCPGIVPQAELLASAGARLGHQGGVKVNSRGETSLGDIYAAGDGVELPAPEGGGTRFTPLATAAARLGRVCGENAAGGSRRLRAVRGCLAVRLFGHQVGVVGHPADWGEAEALPWSWGQSDPHFPSRGRGQGVLFSHRRTGRLVGGQLVGPSAASLVDYLSLAVEQGLTVNDLEDQEYSYNPPLSGLWHPFYLAARENTKNQGVYIQ